MRIMTYILLLLLPVSLICFPVDNYNFRLPNTSLSAYEASLGGICITNAENTFALASNPALLSDVTLMTFSTSLSIPSQKRSFAEIVNTNPILQKSYLRGIALQAKRFGFLYQELANDQIDKSNRFYKEYKDYNLRSYGFSFADTLGKKSWGISFKYLNGRVVYNKQSKQDSIYVVDEFIDSKADGFASDLGYYSKTAYFNYGFVVHDIYSKLYWADYANKKIKTRGTFAVELKSEKISYNSSVTSLWNIHEKPLYCQSIQYFSKISNPQSNQSVGLRFGASSSSYDSSDNILFGLGTAYYINTFKVDISIQTQGWKMSNSQYLLNLSFGE